MIGLKIRIYEILENAHKFNRNPEETYEKILDAIDKHNVEWWNNLLSNTPIDAGISIDNYKVNL